MKFNLESDIEPMKKRVWGRPALGEFFALALAFGMVGVFLWEQNRLPFIGFDLRVYFMGANGNSGYQSYYYLYGYWILPIFSALNKLPYEVGFFLWSSLNIIGVFFAVRVFNGNAMIAILSYQMFYNLAYGNISGVIVGALGLCWYGIVNRKWDLAGLGIALASAKYQLGLIGSILLVLTADISWKNRLRVFLVPTMIWLISLLLYPGWILQAFNILRNYPPNDFGSISLWRWAGPWALGFFLPPLFLKKKPHQKFLALVAAMGLALPYFQHMDLLFLLVLPVGWVGLLGNLGYFMVVYGWNALRSLFIFPLTVFSLILIPELWSAFRVHRILNKYQKIH
jgi:hypothetical protein